MHMLKKVWWETCRRTGAATMLQGVWLQEPSCRHWWSCKLRRVLRHFGVKVGMVASIFFGRIQLPATRSSCGQSYLPDACMAASARQSLFCINWASRCLATSYRTELTGPPQKWLTPLFVWWLCRKEKGFFVAFVQYVWGNLCTLVLSTFNSFALGTEETHHR